MPFSASVALKAIQLRHVRHFHKSEPGLATENRSQNKMRRSFASLRMTRVFLSREAALMKGEDSPEVGAAELLAEVGAVEGDDAAHLVQPGTHAFTDAVTEGFAATGRAGWR